MIISRSGWLLSILFPALAVAAAPASKSLMPEPLTNVYLGMSTDELLAARPDIQREGMLGAKINWNVERIRLYETLPQGGRFSAATYLLEKGTLVSATIIRYPKHGEEAGARREFVREFVAKWGKAYKKRVPRDEVRAGEAIPALSWEINGVEYSLTLPKNRKKGDNKISAIAVQMRAMSVAKKDGWSEAPMVESAKKAYFENHDVQDDKP